MEPRIIRRIRLSSRKSEFIWRYLINFLPVIIYKFSRSSFSSESLRVLSDLNRHGIAITSTQALLGSDSCFEELSQEIELLEQKFAAQIAERRIKINGSNDTGRKSYIYKLIEKERTIARENIYTRFANQQSINQIVNAYLGIRGRLSYYGAGHTLPTDSPAKESQLWHRDSEDRYVVKVFVYLTDVDDDAGPFVYAPGTHLKGLINKEPTFIVEKKAKRSSDEQMSEIVPPEQWIKAIGSKGTIIFADTKGYHKGGLARKTDRIMCTFEFTSWASSDLRY